MRSPNLIEKRGNHRGLQNKNIHAYVLALTLLRPWNYCSSGSNSGIGIGAYPFGSAGLDLLLLGLLRPFLAGLGCVAFATGLRRANLQRVALENCDGEAHSSVTDTTAAINHTIPSDSSNIGISQSEWRNRRGKSGTALRGDGDEVVDVARSESQVSESRFAFYTTSKHILTQGSSGGSLCASISALSLQQRRSYLYVPCLKSVMLS